VRRGETALENRLTVPRVMATFLRSMEFKRVFTRDGDLPGLEAELQEHLREIEEIGCFFKDGDFSVGLVDFPAVIDGETVFLCWRSDESELAWYHPVEEGFGGRRPLPKTSPVE